MRETPIELDRHRVMAARDRHPRYVLNLYSAGLAPADTHYRDLVAAVLADLTRLSGEEA